MSLDVEMTNNDNTPIHSLSEQMQTLQVPDNNHNTLAACEYCKDGKLLFNEAKLRAESHPTIAEKLLQYRAYRAQLEKDQDNLTQQTADIPASYMDLIAALVQDSDESFPALTSRVNDLLSPFLRNENVANKFESAIEKAVKKIAHKINYGLTEEIYSNIEHTAPKIPWHLYISRWEVKDVELLPVEMQQAVLQRRKIRENMTGVFSEFIQNLPPNERSTIVNTKHRKSPVIVQKESEDLRQKQALESEQEKEEKRKKKEEEKKKRDEEKRLHEEEKRLRDEEKKAIEEEKKRQREEEKRLREEEKRLRDEEKKRREDEKKKKEQSQLRLTSLFTKSSHVETTPLVEKLLEPAKPTLFPAFYIKDHVTISNINHQSNNTTSSSYQDFRNAINSKPTVSINNFLSEINHDSKQKRGVSTHVDIRTLLLPGSADILHVPNVRLVLRMKLLQFTENVRPAYYGSWTQKSHKVTGKTPFAKDQDKLDYDHDSEAEWEPEGEGEDIVSGDEDDDDPNTDMIDPEDAGWLVPEGYLSDNEGVEEEEEKYNRFVGKSSSSKRIAVRKIVLGPYFQGETEEEEVMKPFETNFFIDVSNEGFNPFYKEPVSRINATTNTNTSSSTATNATATTTSNTGKNEFTDEHRAALINVINEKSGDSIPNLISEAKSNYLLKDVSKRQLEANIKNIAVKEKRGNDTKPTWYIKDPSTSSA